MTCGKPQIFYEAPHRILATLADIEAIFGPTQHVVVARELTKLHEEFLRGAVSEVRKTLAARATVRGEIVLLFVPAAAESASDTAPTSIAAEVRALMKRRASPKRTPSSKSPAPAAWAKAKPTANSNATAASRDCSSLLPPLHPVVHIPVAGRPQRFVVQAGRPGRLVQLLAELVDGVQVLRRRGNLHLRRLQELLVAPVHQPRDLRRPAAIPAAPAARWCRRARRQSPPRSRTCAPGRL